MVQQRPPGKVRGESRCWSPTPCGSRGSGIRIIDHLTKVWGCTPFPGGGKIVWANLVRG